MVASTFRHGISDEVMEETAAGSFSFASEFYSAPPGGGVKYTDSGDLEGHSNGNENQEEGGDPPW